MQREIRMLCEIIRKRIYDCERAARENRIDERRAEARGRAAAYRNVLRILRPMARAS